VLHQPVQQATPAVRWRHRHERDVGRRYHRTRHGQVAGVRTGVPDDRLAAARLSTVDDHVGARGLEDGELRLAPVALVRRRERRPSHPRDGVEVLGGSVAEQVPVGMRLRGHETVSTP
jgi:hypothetical protein